MRAALLATLLLGCNSSSPSDPTDAGVDAAMLCQGPFPAETTACADITTPAARSCALAGWPMFPPATGSDLTTATNATTTLVPGTPAGVVVGPDGQWVFAAVGKGMGGQLGALRRQGATPTWDHGIMMPAGEIPFGLALSPDGTLLAVALSDEVAIFDRAKVESNAADALLGLVPDHSAMKVSTDLSFSTDGALLFVATEYDRGVAVIDVAQRSYIGAIPVAGNAVTSVVVSPDGARVYITCEVATAFAKDNPMPENDQVVGLLTIADVAKAATDPAHAVLGSVFAGRAPVRTILSADGAIAWTTARGSNAVLAFDTANMLANPDCAFLSATAVGPAPVGLGLVRSGAKLVVANSNRFAMPLPDGTLSLLDSAKARAGAADALLGQLTVGAFPREMDADATSLFVSNYASQSLSGIDLSLLSP